MSLKSSDLYQIGFDYIKAGRFEDSERVLLSVIEKSDDIDIPLHILYNAIGTAKINLIKKDIPGAIAYHEKALAGDPTLGLHWTNLAYDHMVNNNPNEAIRLCRNALQVNPKVVDIYVKLTNSLHLAGRHWEAYEAQIQSLLIQEDAHLRLGLGCTELLLSDMQYEPLYRTGLSNYAYRNELSPHGKTITPLSRNLADHNLKGYRFALFLEQGLGDAVMMIPYVQELVTRHGSNRVYLVSIDHESSLEVYRTLGILPDSQLFTLDQYNAVKSKLSYPREFWFMDLLSLGLPKDIVQGQLPDAYYNVTVSSGFNDKVGICWRGNKAFPNYHWRTLHFDDLKEFIKEHGPNLVNLQAGLTPEEHQFLSDNGVLIADTSHLPTLYTILKSLKKVITTCTFMSHISGILGVPCDTLLSTFHDWRWGMRSETTPWYKNHRLLRQKNCGNWEDQLDAAGKY